MGKNNGPQSHGQECVMSAEEPAKASRGRGPATVPLGYGASQTSSPWTPAWAKVLGGGEQGAPPAAGAGLCKPHFGYKFSGGHCCTRKPSALPLVSRP